MKTILATISDSTHALLEKIKAKKGFSNNNDLFEWLIQEVAARLQEEGTIIA